MSDLRSAAEMSRGHAKGEEDRADAQAGEEGTPVVISSCCWSSVAGVRGAVNAFSNALNN